MAKEESSKAKGSSEENVNALAARRQRLRGSLTQQNLPAVEAASQASPVEHTHSTKKESHAAQAKNVLGPENANALELLGHIDQALSSCAGHLASLQKVASKQIDELKVIADTLQNHTFSDVGVNINTLMESLTAAIEPMKAIGELVPALDKLVNITDVRDQQTNRTQVSDKQLVTSLAEQLMAGIIDPWTFKCAYRAVFPDYDPTSIFHQLGELLGEQELSGELFQVAYEALQSAQPPAPSMPNILAEQIADGEEGILLYGDETAQQVSERENQLVQQLAEKEKELEEIRAQLDLRWQEMSKECENLRTSLEGREGVLREKETELGEKISELAARNSENQQLRSQMEELRDQTKNMVADLQKQLAQKQAEEKAIRAAKSKSASSQPGFFDLVTPQSGNLLNAATAAPQLFEENEDVVKTSAGKPAQSAPGPVETAARQTAQVGTSNTIPTSTVSSPNYNSPASFVSTTGSYGSGVRAQVFEVIVRQALAGAHWREICAVPMQINNIAPEEVEAEVKRRQALLKK